MSRVLSTDEAKEAIRQIQSIVNGGLTDQIQALDNQGQRLSAPDVWDGPLASQFRGQVWPETRNALEKAKAELEQLRANLQKIATDIFTAGGGQQEGFQWWRGGVPSRHHSSLSLGNYDVTFGDHNVTSREAIIALLSAIAVSCTACFQEVWGYLSVLCL